jgi:glycosyltransferase involved in cell wall biosynthesis
MTANEGEPVRQLHLFAYDPSQIGLDPYDWPDHQLARWPIAAVAASSVPSEVHYIHRGVRTYRTVRSGLRFVAHPAITSGPGRRAWGDEWSSSLTRTFLGLRSGVQVWIHGNGTLSSERAVLHGRRRGSTVTVLHGRGADLTELERTLTSAVITLRRDQAEELVAQGLAPSRIATVLPSVDSTQFYPYERSCSPRRPRIGFVGRVEPTKGSDELIPTLVRLRALGISATLDVVGPIDAAYRERIEREAASNQVASDLKLLGLQPPTAVAELMRTWDVLFAPSFTEGVSLAVLEALSASLPAVVRAGVLPREIEGHSLILPATPTKFADALISQLRRHHDRTANFTPPSHAEAGELLARISNWTVSDPLRGRPIGLTYPLRHAIRTRSLARLRKHLLMLRSGHAS